MTQAQKDKVIRNRKLSQWLDGRLQRHLPMDDHQRDQLEKLASEIRVIVPQPKGKV